MKQTFILSVLVMVAMIGTISCSQSIQLDDDPSLAITNVSESGTRSEEGNMLAFENEIDFQMAIDMVASFDTDEEKLQWVEKRFPEFSSIQSLYWEAMHEMGDIDAEDKDVAERFLSKYSALYFPLYEEDGGFYIPMKNLDAAFLVNENCEVRVAGEVRNLRDIWSYDTLMELGRAYYSLDMPVTLGAMGSFTLKSTSQNSVGPEYDSGWKEYGSKKVKLKARRVFKKMELAVGFYGSQSFLHLEFCFRKKGWFGWGNVSRKSTITFKTTLPSINRPLTFSQSHNGNSSHDSEFLYPVKITRDASNVYYTFEEVNCNASVEFEGISELLTYVWTMPGIQAISPGAKGPAAIVPNY